MVSRKVELIGRDGSRSGPITKLEAFIKDSAPGFRCLHGVSKIGKTALVNFVANENAVELLSIGDEYREFAVSDVAYELQKFVGGKRPVGSTMEGRLCLLVPSLLRRLARSRAAQKLVIRVHVNHWGTGTQAESVHLHFDGSRVPVVKWIFERRRDFGSLKWHDSKPFLERRVPVCGLHRTEAVDLVKERLAELGGQMKETAMETFAVCVYHYCGRHPDLLRVVGDLLCSKLRSLVRSGEWRQGDVWCASRVEACVCHVVNADILSLEEMIEQILDGLPKARKYIEITRVQRSSASIEDRGGAFDLQEAGLTLEVDELPKIFELIRMRREEGSGLEAGVSSGARRELPLGGATYHVEGDMIVGQKFKDSQVGFIATDGAVVGDVTIRQMWNRLATESEVEKLPKELAILREAMKRESTSTEHEEAIVGIGNAQEAADQGDGPEALRRLGALKSMGKWALDVADKASVTVAAAALKAALGI